MSRHRFTRPSVHWALRATVALIVLLMITPADAASIASAPVASSATMSPAVTSATMSQPRRGAAAVTVGDKVVFGGGTTSGAPSNVVDIFDAATETWTTAHLSVGRERPHSVVVGEQALIFGGIESTGYASAAVDIFDLPTRTWSASMLTSPWPTTSASSQRLSQPKPVVSGSRAIFVHQGAVDIYDAATRRWDHFRLAVARRDASVVAAGAVVVIAGGEVAPGVPSDSVDIFDTVTGVWSIAQLSRARTRSTAVVVGGRAIIAGGYAGGSPAPEIDIYDVNSGSWSTAALAPSVARESVPVPLWPVRATVVGQTALFVNNVGAVTMYDATTNAWTAPSLPTPVYGEPVIVGQTVVFVSTQGIALYDSAAQTWTRTEFGGDRSLGYTRTIGTVVTTDTKVIIAGGTGPQRSNTVPYSAVEILDVPSRRWTRLAMGHAATQPLAAAIGDDRVLVTGSSFNHFEAATARWQSETIPTPRVSVSPNALAVATAGPYVLVAGGDHSSLANGIAPWDVPGVTDAVDLWDSRTGQWTAARLSQARRSITPVSLGSLVLFAGGVDSWGGAYSDTIDVYDSASGRWSVSRAPAALSPERPLVLGTSVGFRGAVSSESPATALYVFDTVTERWQTVTLSEPRFGVTIVGAGTVALIAGGTRQQYVDHSDAVDLYDAATGRQWVTRLSEARTNIAAAVIGSRVLLAGGTNAGPRGPNAMRSSSVVDVYDADTDTWRADTLLEPRWSPRGSQRGIAVVGSKALFAGVVTLDPQAGVRQVSPLVQIYDSQTDRWSAVPLSDGRSVFDVAVVSSKVIFAGGMDHIGGAERPVRTVDIYDDATGRWSTGQRPVARAHSNVVIVPGFAVFTVDSTTEKTHQVEIYDAATDGWSVATLPSGDRNATVAAAGSRIFFAGGGLVSSSEETSRRLSLPAVDIFDTADGTWSVTSLSRARQDMIPASVGSQVLFAGGGGSVDHRVVSRLSALVDIFDLAATALPRQLPGDPY